MSIGDTDFGVQVGIGFIGRVVTMLVAFLGAIVLARVLGPDGYGSFYILMATVSVLDNPVTGWANACRKRLTEEGFPAGEAVGSTLLGVLVAAIAVTLGSWLAAPYIAQFTGQPDGWALLSLLFLGMVTYVGTLEILKASAQFGMSQWMIAGRDVVRVLAQGALVLAGLGVVGMVGGMVIANLLAAPVVIYLLGIRPEFPSRETVRSVSRFARSSIPNGFFSTAQNRMDTLLLAFLATPGIVGNYEVALRLTTPAMFVAGVAGSGLMGRISNRRSKQQDVENDIQNNLSYVSIIALPLFVGALTVGTPVIVTLFSNQYSGAGAFVAGLALFHLFRSQKTVLGSTLDGFDRPDLNLRISGLVFGLNLLLGVALFFAIGPIGVVVATIISEAVGYVTTAYLVRSLVPSLTLIPQPVIHQAVSGLVMGTVVYTARELLPLRWWGYVIFVVALGGGTYFATLLVISEPFRGTVRAITRDAGLI
ncbi:oligosaccharide flippase family protein [Halomicroarcula sp. F13]|uniref:Oligosaccharide flippase family protein n=1 Tax=Haloarcula rubra TaxID=2487747 RepID=A0AAW4PPT1_9EURY|nr:oligosaccharide flippase family protein [Halomicroarcula rubra]MBX0323119.1 oligosaccharide flippase family protein [Halomicroarcula rubra]